MGALKNWFNTLSSYNLVSNQLDKCYLIYLQKCDKAWKKCRKMSLLLTCGCSKEPVVENSNFLSEGLLLTCGYSENRFNTYRYNTYKLGSNQSDKWY